MSVGVVDKSTGDRIPTAGNPLDKVGNLANLTTTAKGSAVEAINEVNATKANQTQLATVEESTTASKAYSANEYLVLGGVLYKVTANIAQGGTIVTEGSGKNANLATVGSELSAINSNLATLQNDIEGAWEELTFADVVTLSQDVTTTGTPKAYRRGNRIRLHFDVTGTLTVGAGGYKNIGTLKTAYKPTRINYLPTAANKASSGAVMYPFIYVISSNSGNINLVTGPSELGNANNSWMGGDSVEIVYELS